MMDFDDLQAGESNLGVREFSASSTGAELVQGGGRGAESGGNDPYVLFNFESKSLLIKESVSRLFGCVLFVFEFISFTLCLVLASTCINNC